MSCRLVFLVLTGVFPLGSGMPARAETVPFEQAVWPFFQEHCMACHGEEKQKGDFRLDTLARDFREGHDAEWWHEVIIRMGAGEMPPEDEPQPSAEEASRVMEWLAERIEEGEAARKARRPPVAHYRLSREEYSHTIYDLLGVHFDARAPGAFTEDPDWHGFERIGSELSLSPSHVEKYLAAAEEILDNAFPEVEPRQLNNRRDALDIDWHNREKRPELEAIGVAEHVRTLIWPGHRLSYLRPAPGHNHEPGVYRARLQVSGLAPEGGRPPHLELYSKKLDRVIFETDVLAPEHEPAIFTFETFLPAGRIDIAIRNAVPGPSNSGRSGRPGGFVFTTLDDPKSRAPWQRKMTDDEGRPLYPFLIFDWIEWEGPIVTEEERARREGLFPETGEDPVLVEASLRRFLERAWRRPVTAEELGRYVSLVEKGRAAGDSFQESYRSALLGVLASKNFTYLVEGEPGRVRDQIDDWELASRLSFFLWNSMPDEQLFAAARAGRLSEPDSLRSEVERMISDPKISRFTSSFPRQWLQLKKVGLFPPDEELYPDYDKWLEQSMILESQHFFAEVFARDLPLGEFLDSDWTMLNPRLAYHYGLPIPKQSGFRRVALREEDNRGGILTHASVLSLTSDGTRHRPVHRGIWVSEAIWGKTPPPPPANVDAIEPNPVDAPKATIRMKLAAHIEHESCASCHAKIDPLGLAFDNYDAIGRWRTTEIVPKGTGPDPEVDASGVLPDGRRFETPGEFKELLVDDVETFARAFAEKLATYALRRVMTVDDRADLERIVTAARDDDFRLRSLVVEVATSELLRKR